MDPRQHVRKLVLLGDASVGKTSLLHRYTHNHFREIVNPTVGASYATLRVMQTDGSVLKVDLWDTAGQERYRSLTPMYYKNASAAVVVFDITSAKSYQGALAWIEEAKDSLLPEAVIALVANKVDLQKRCVDLEAAYFAHQNRYKYFEVSAKTGTNVRETFADITSELCTAVPTPRSSVALVPSAHSEPSSQWCCR